MCCLKDKAPISKIVLHPYLVYVRKLLRAWLPKVHILAVDPWPLSLRKFGFSWKGHVPQSSQKLGSTWFLHFLSGM